MGRASPNHAVPFSVNSAANLFFGERLGPMRFLRPRRREAGRKTSARTGSEPKDILVVLVTRIGDTLLATPTLRALRERWPAARITVVVHPKRMDLLKNLPFVDALRPWGAGFRMTARLLPGRRHDLAFVFSSDRRQIAAARACADHVVAFGSPAEGDEATTFVSDPVGLHAARARAALVGAAGVEPRDFRLAFALDTAEMRWAAEARREIGGAPLVALQLHSFPTKKHRDWPLAHFTALVEKILEVHPQARFVITGDAATTPSAERLIAGFGDRVVDRSGRLDLRHTAALLSVCDLYVGVDTGPTHLAGAVGVPMVALYHAAYPGRNLAPIGHTACRVLEHPATGAAGAEAADMADIPPAEVARAALELIAERGSR